MLAGLFNGRTLARLQALGSDIATIRESVVQGAASVGEQLDEAVIQRIVNDIATKLVDRPDILKNLESYSFTAGRYQAIKQKTTRISHLPTYDAQFKSGSENLRNAVEEHLMRLYPKGPKAPQHVKKANRFRTFVEYFTSDLTLKDVSELLDIGVATVNDHAANFRNEMWPHLSESGRWVLSYKLHQANEREAQVLAAERPASRAERMKAYQEKYREENRGKKNETARLYREANREKFKLAAREYRARKKAGLQGWW